MPGIDVVAVVATYKNAEPLFSLESGDQVVGELVDDDNRLVYVIATADRIYLSYAEYEKPILPPPTRRTITTTVTLPSTPQDTP
jgi:hypothetical protein